MRRHLPNTLHHTDCTRRATAGRRNRYVRAAHIIYGTAAGNIIPATTVAPKYGNGSPVPVSGINFSYRIDHKNNGCGYYSVEFFKKQCEVASLSRRISPHPFYYTPPRSVIDCYEEGQYYKIQSE